MTTPTPAEQYRALVNKLESIQEAPVTPEFEPFGKLAKIVPAGGKRPKTAVLNADGVTVTTDDKRKMAIQVMPDSYEQSGDPLTITSADPAKASLPPVTGTFNYRYGVFVSQSEFEKLKTFK